MSAIPRPECPKCGGPAGRKSQAPIEADLNDENPDDVIRREQSREAQKRAKYERALQGEW